MNTQELTDLLIAAYGESGDIEYPHVPKDKLPEELARRPDPERLAALVMTGGVNATVKTRSEDDDEIVGVINRRKIEDAIVSLLAEVSATSQVGRRLRRGDIDATTADAVIYRAAFGEPRRTS